MTVRAMVLAAGFGTRLRPLTEELPKPLVPVANRPLVTYALAMLARAGVSEVAINLHHLGEKIQAALGDDADLGLALTYSPEVEILGTGGGVARMRPFLERSSFFLVNGDVLVDTDLQAVLRFHRERAAAATMVVRPLPPDVPYTPLGIDDEGWLTDFKDAHRPPRGKTHPVMFCGVHVLDPRVFDFLPPDGFSCINSQAYTRMLLAGLDVAAFVEPGPWYDLGTPATYLQANLDILTGRSRFSQLAPAGTRSPDGVLRGRDVAVDPTARVGPEVVIGDGASIGAGARVARCVLWPEARVTEGESLEGAIVSGQHVVEV